MLKHNKAGEKMKAESLFISTNGKLSTPGLG
jgi:hypothetical protein